MNHMAGLVSFIIIYWFNIAQSAFSNISYTGGIIKDHLPEIRDGEKCVSGKLYRMGCNTCRCGKRSNLFCTKMACLDKDHINLLKRQMKKKKSLRGKVKIPVLPKGECEPGVVYVAHEGDCSQCFCGIDRTAVCTTKKCPLKLSKGKSSLKMKTLGDVRPPFTKSEKENMKTLPHRAAECTPGESYKVDCNICVCLANGNLLCTEKLCISYDDFNKIEARKKNGMACKEDDKLDFNCLKCTCEKNELSCDAIMDCIPHETIKLLLGTTPVKKRLEINAKLDVCIPFMVYRDNCNKCYCQEDKHLRCTRKACLNHSQHVALTKHRQYLEKHGL